MALPRQSASQTLRASVTAENGGVNDCPNPALRGDATGWTPVAGSTSTLTWLAPGNIPGADPIGAGEGAATLTWSGDALGTADGLSVPDFSIVAGETYIVSLYVYVPSGSPDVVLVADGTVSPPSTGTNDDWVRLSVVWVAASDTPVIEVQPTTAPDLGLGESFTTTACLIQPGSTLNDYTDGGGQEGDPANILVDGSDSAITANGLAGYLPTPGDRLLVQKVGGQVEIVQFLSRGTVPYVADEDLSDLSAQVNANTDLLSDHDTEIAANSSTLTDYMTTTDITLGGLQAGYDVLTGLGDTGVVEDYIWVGDDPSLSTVKLVQISTYVQAGLASGDDATLSAYFNLWTRSDVGDLTFSGTTDPPMTTFYNVFTANGLLAEPWN